jgi:ferric-dicitrate binding protein FerR (iron transport regulator)
MNTPRYAAAAAKLLRRHLPLPGVASHEPARSLATIQRAMQLRSRRRRLAAVLVVAAAAASAMLGVKAAGWLSSPLAAAPVSINVSPAGHGAAVRTNRGELPLATNATLETGQRIETPPDGGAALQLSTGTAMNLAGRTSFRVESQGTTQRFSLLRGELSAHVAKLGLGQRFIVGTPDAQVEVRGTRFTVKVLEHGGACGAGSRTRLDVTEGIVEVRAASVVVSVRAGQHWPNDCHDSSPLLTPASASPQPEKSPGASATTDAERPASEQESAAPRSPANAAAPAPERTSALARQNDLFAEGVAKRRQGDVSGALRAYDDLIKRFPSSPLAQNAAVERMRLLAAEGDPRAAVEARRYVARYPNGFALEEARQLAEKR